MCTECYQQNDKPRLSMRKSGSGVFRLSWLVWCGLVITGLFGAGPVAAFSLKIPEEALPLRSGETFTVQVDMGKVGGIREVRYFWYGEQEDMLEEFESEKLALVATAEHSPPFGGSLRVPLEAIGMLRLLAIAVPESGRLQQEHWSIFDEALLPVEPQADLVEIDFETDKPLMFGRATGTVVYDQVNFLGTVFALPVVGHFSDDVIRPLRLQATGTTYESDNPAVVVVERDGLLRLVGNGQATLRVRNSGKEATLEVLVEVNDEPNEPPVPDPGPDQVVQAGTRVQLNGLGSYDPEGGSLEYYWSQIRGSKVPLLNPMSAKASFLAPLVVEERLFRFKLRVTDHRGADSLPAYVDVTVLP